MQKSKEIIMRIGHLLNAEICCSLATLGHTDTIAIGDAGLPIPVKCQRIDLALSQGVPSFLQVFHSVIQEMQIEKITLANELFQKNAYLHDKIIRYIKHLEEKRGSTISIDYISHNQFKEEINHCKTIIRSGECSPYANVILQAGVIF